MSEKLTFYGHFSGAGSYVTVCNAIMKVLAVEFKDKLQIADLGPGFSDVTFEPPAPGGIGLMFSIPENLPKAEVHDHMIGYHVCDLSQIPRHWTELMNSYCDEVLTPSFWCKEVFEACGVSLPVNVIRHGVNSKAALSVLSNKHIGASFVFLHFCSSKDPGRKGTMELIEAFEEVEPDIPGAFLLIHSDSPQVVFRAKNSKAQILCARPYYQCDYSQARRYSGANVAVQPSRAEGFGMIPLEALCSGTPVISTLVTGHAEWYSKDLKGLVEVPTSYPELQACTPGPGLAPGLEVSDLAAALFSSYRQYYILAEEASSARQSLARAWEWQKVLHPLVDKLRSLGL